MSGFRSIRRQPRPVTVFFRALRLIPAESKSRAAMSGTAEKKRNSGAPSERPTVVPYEIPLSKIDPDALKVVKRLRRFGHTAYLVGGCVRDLLLGVQPKDFDVATSARPNQIRSIFRNCRLIGRRFRLAHILFRGKIIETATFRADSSERNGDDLLITSDNVFGTEEQDALRRDFTINGLFYDPLQGAIIDYVGGVDDIGRGVLRFIGQPAIRAREDPVRILRAVRISSKLGFSVEPESFEAMEKWCCDIARCARPRLLEELVRLLRCGAAAGSFRLLWRIGALDVLLPWLATYLARSPERGEEREPGVGLYAHLVALDRTDRELLSNPVLLAILVMHPVADMVKHGTTGYGFESDSLAPGELAHRITRDMVTRLALPRWQAERIQQLVACQFRFVKLRPRGGVPRSILRRVYLPEALDLFDLSVKATGRGYRVLRLLQGLSRSAAAVSGERRTGGPDGNKSKKPRRKESRKKEKKRKRPKNNRVSD